MKRTVAILLTLAALVLAACGNGGSLSNSVSSETQDQTESAVTGTAGTDERQVPAPTKAPSYAFDHTPTIDEMRAMAVKAMRDMLSIQYFPEKTVRYNKLGAVSNKDFQLLEDQYYMGMPYTSAGTGLFQFLAYYDSETGCLTYTEQSTFNEMVGNSCASSACWGLAAVCSSVQGGMISNFLTVSNGFYPLGGVSYDASVTDFAEYFTKRIVQDNGAAKVLAGYAAVQPGDLLVYSDNSDGRGHTRMAIEAANVSYKDGAIDPDASFIMVQEQAAQDAEDTSTGVNMIRTGNLSKKYTFSQLLSGTYIAVSTAEFLGKKAYEPCRVTFDGDASTMEGLAAGTVRCNYPMAVLRVVLHKDDGDVVLKQTLFNRKTVGDGSAREYLVSQSSVNLAGDRRLPKSGAYTVTLEVTASTGETFTPAVVTVDG